MTKRVLAFNLELYYKGKKEKGYSMIIDLEKTKINTFLEGKAALVASMCKKLKLTAIMNENLTSDLGRKPEIAYGTLIEMMIVNMCDDHKSLSQLGNYYNNYRDLEGIFQREIECSKLTDDRFGLALDHLYEAEPKKIFARIASNVFQMYNIKITKINFDITSKVMWGTYETEHGEEARIEITYGHSKDKRSDKKQVKMAIGSANGIVVDIEALSGNASDKTYNFDKLDGIENIMKNFEISKNDFHYIADSAFFTKKNIVKANENGIKFITSVPKSMKIANEMRNFALSEFDNLQEIEIKTTKKAGIYKLSEKKINYKGIELKLALCHSGPLVKKKTKTLERKIKKEEKAIKKLEKNFIKMDFACEKDALSELNRLEKKRIKKIKFYKIDLKIAKKEVKKPGRQPKDPLKSNVNIKYNIEISYSLNEKRKDEFLKSSCMFVLATSNLDMTGEEILREYKTQDSVEKNFQLLKSPQFVNAIYLESPKRIEAFMYLMMLTVMIKSVIQYIIRQDLKENDEYIIGTRKEKNYKPTFAVIYESFSSISTMLIEFKNDNKIRQLTKPLTKDVIKMLESLQLEQDIFTKGSK